MRAFQDPILPHLVWLRPAVIEPTRATPSLSELPFFRGSDAAALAKVAAAARWRTVEPGHVVVDDDEPSTDIFFVAAGAVMYIVAFATGQRGLATTAATLTFAGLGFAFVYLSWKALQREPPLRRAAFRMVPDDAEDDGVDSPDDFDADENLAKDDLTEEDDSPRRGM